jgi:hypothetical protein
MVNAFWLDHDLDRAARWHADDHVLSGVLECCTVLTTAARMRGYPDDSLTGGYEHNPLTEWAADSVENWRYLREYVASVQEEWRHRWDHAPDETHGAWEPVYALDDAVLDGLDWPSTGRTAPPRITGDWEADDHVEAYRLYYANEKREVHGWKGDREAPPWLDEYRRPEGPPAAGGDGA